MDTQVRENAGFQDKGKNLLCKIESIMGAQLFAKTACPGKFRFLRYGEKSAKMSWTVRRHSIQGGGYADGAREYAA